MIRNEDSVAARIRPFSVSESLKFLMVSRILKVVGSSSVVRLLREWLAEEGWFCFNELWGSLWGERGLE